MSKTLKLDDKDLRTIYHLLLEHADRQHSLAKSQLMGDSLMQLANEADYCAKLACRVLDSLNGPDEDQALTQDERDMCYQRPGAPRNVEGVIRATKSVRNRTGLRLADCKRIVDAYMASRGWMVIRENGFGDWTVNHDGSPIPQ